jgi:hypothetical protein
MTRIKSWEEMMKFINGSPDRYINGFRRYVKLQSDIVLEKG